MGAYIWAFLRSIVGPGWLWWISLGFAYFLGIGYFSDYPKARDQINSVCGSLIGVAPMPETVPWWLIVGPFLIWVVFRLAHREAMTHLWAGRVEFEQPWVHRNVELWGGPRGGAGRTLVGTNDIAKIVVRNRPYNGARGTSIEDCYASIEFFDEESKRPMLNFDYPRWQNNPKPGREGNPGDHIRDDWNRRTLRPTGEANTLNFLVKSIDNGFAFGLRTNSQLQPMWHDEKLRLNPGNYFAKLTLSGTGMRRPAEKWLHIRVGGAGQSIEVDSSKPIDTARWL